MSLLLHPYSRAEIWRDAIASHLPDLPIDLWPDVTDASAVRYLACWHHDWDELTQYPNLEALLILGAGFDHVDLDAVPPQIKIVRLADPAMAMDMAEYCLGWVSRFSRSYDQYSTQQQSSIWQPVRRQRPTVGVLGLGEIGGTVAKVMQQFGYHVISWSRSAKKTPFGRHYAGVAELHELLAESDTLINVLPHNDATEGLLGSAELNLMAGGVFINVGRGSIVAETDLVAALDHERNRLEAAVLDVFATEPLPPTSPLWSHPRVTITPHVSGETPPTSAAAIIAANVARLEAGEAPFLRRPKLVIVFFFTMAGNA